jgi:hypothetical protein
LLGASAAGYVGYKEREKDPDAALTAIGLGIIFAIIAVAIIVGGLNA